MTSLVLRLARPDELSTLAAIELGACELFAPYPEIYRRYLETSSSLASYERSIRAHMLWMAEVDAVPVGFAMVCIVDTHAHLDELDVLPSYGRRGVGTALVQQTLSFARDCALGPVTLSTLRDIPWNAPFYTKLGFRILAPHELGPGLSLIAEKERAWGMHDRVMMRHEGL